MHSGNLTIPDLRHIKITGMVHFQRDEDTLSISFCCMESGVPESEELDGNILIKTRIPVILPSSAPFILLKVIDEYACFIMLYILLYVLLLCLMSPFRAIQKYSIVQSAADEIVYGMCT